MRRDRRRLVKNQNGFNQHVDPAENPHLDFNKVTISSIKTLNYIDDGKNHRTRRIRGMAWGLNPWVSEKGNRLVKDVPGFIDHVDIADNPTLNFDELTTADDVPLNYTDEAGRFRCRIVSEIFRDDQPWKACLGKYNKHPLVRDQKGFSEHVNPADNPRLNFETVTTGSSKYLNYKDNNGKKRHGRINLMSWDKDPWAGYRKRSPLVRDQEGFMEHVNLADNPHLDFDKVTIGSRKSLFYKDDEENERRRIIKVIDWANNPWVAENNNAPLLRDQEGFSEHVNPADNPHLDFDKITIRSKKFLFYRDDDGKRRHRKIYVMFRYNDPWSGEKKKKPLVRDQEGFSDHVNPADNPEIDFDKVTIGSGKNLLYYDRDGIKRNKRIKEIPWDEDPWEGSKVRKSLVRDQEGFSEHVNPADNPELDFDTLTIGSSESLTFIDDDSISRHRIIRYMPWDDNPWKSLQNMDELIGEDGGFWTHCDETDLPTINNLKKCKRNSKKPVKMHCDKGHHYTTSPRTFFSKVKNPCPFCDGRLIEPGETDAATVDPELEVFFIPEENNVDIHRISPKAKTRLKWKCPYCSHIFKRCVRLIVNKHPKCPTCLDTGMTDASNLNNENNSHMIVVRSGEKDD